VVIITSERITILSLKMKRFYEIDISLQKKKKKGGELKAPKYPGYDKVFSGKI